MNRLNKKKNNHSHRLQIKEVKEAHSLKLLKPAFFLSVVPARDSCIEIWENGSIVVDL